MNLPMPEYGKTDKETIINLMDTVIKLRKELEYALHHLDGNNIPSLSDIVGDIDGNHTLIEQNEGSINLLAADVAGNEAQIIIQADEIQQIVTDINNNLTSITQNADEIILHASRINTVETNTMSNSTDIGILNSRVSSAETSISQNADEIILKADKTTTDTIISDLGVVETRVSSAESSITLNADRIATKVSETDYNGNTIASLINQTATTIDIEASKINLNGVTTMNGLTYVNDTLTLGNASDNAFVDFASGCSLGVSYLGDYIFQGSNFFFSTSSNPGADDYNGDIYCGNIYSNGSQLATEDYVDWNTYSDTYIDDNFVRNDNSSDLQIGIDEGSLLGYVWLGSSSGTPDYCFDIYEL